MSRAYSMNVAISGFDRDRREAIQKAAEAEWPFDDWYLQDPKESPAFERLTLTASGYGSLGGGETEDEFAQRLAVAIWKANGGYCEVEVDATYMEELPHETYTFDEDSYGQLTGKKQEEPHV